MKQVLINGTHKEEKRVAFLIDGKLYDLDIEPVNKVQFKSNVYLGKVARIEPSLDAAFVNYGAERHGFLPFKELHGGYLKGKQSADLKINDVLKENQTVLVQVEKEERGTKGAALTTYVALAGRYLVFLPNSPTAGGISRRLSSEDRDNMREILQQLSMPENTSVIIRTAGVGQQIEDINNDLEYLKKLWKTIEKVAKGNTPPKLIYQDNNFVNRIMRDYVTNDVNEVVADTQSLYEECKDLIIQAMPEMESKISFYEDESIPLFNRYKVEEQIETAYQHEVQLPSGGSITIDHTEALVSIDINSSKSTKGVDIEETALHTNLEACKEIARQMRLRDIGGLIVIDFIDMTPSKNIRQVETQLKDSLRYDRARIQLGRISRFGLMEMSRQRLRASLTETSTTTCPKCQGQGVIRTTESLSLSIFRLMQEQVYREKTVQVRARLPLAIATYLLNEKRDEFNNLEITFSVSIIVLPSNELQPPHYEITWVQEDGRTQVFTAQNDLDAALTDTENKLRNKALSRMKPIVKGEPPTKQQQKGMFARFLSSLGLGSSTTATPTAKITTSQDAKKNYSGSRVRNSARYRNRTRARSTSTRRQSQKAS